jgi:hypothetical protein
MFSEEEACYECNCTVVGHRDYLEITTWVYLGVFKMNSNSADCDIPFHFYRFAKSEDFHPWKKNGGSELAAINLTSINQIRRRFVDRKAMLDYVVDWHDYLSAPNADG